MSDCCPTSGAADKPPGKYRCPVNGKEYAGASSTTIMHHIKEPWSWKPKQLAYYYCEDPECSVVYFSTDDSTIEKSALRTSIGIKETSKSSLVCYCFGVTLDEAATNPDIKDFVIQQTKQHTCACESRNPSGRCCLKDFPKT